MAWQRACATDALTENAMRAFAVGDAEVLVVRSRDGFFAYPPLCPHEQAELEFGTCDGALITCMQHLWQWDVATGAPVGAALIGLDPYPVRVEDGAVYVDLGG